MLDHTRHFLYILIGVVFMRTYAETMSIICVVLLVFLILCTSCSPRQYTIDDLEAARSEAYQDGYRNGYDDATLGLGY